MKRPAFQFYPADWRKDSALQSCSLSAQGLWINLMCVMHECDRYGHLSVNDKPMTTAQISRISGISPKECQKILDELEGAGVFSRLPDGMIFSRRMVKDENLRNVRADAGRLGGNPALLKHKDNQEDNQTDNLSVKQSPTPSSSSSSSLTSTTVAKSAPPPCPHLEIIALYAKRLPAGRQPDPALWNGPRAQHLQARWREKPERQNLEWWDRWFSFIAQSDFLTGKVAPTAGRKQFELSLDWIIKNENWVKIHEGAYK